MSNSGVTQHNFTLPAVSGPWIYSPGRDTDPGWTAAYTDTPNINSVVNNEGSGHMYFRTQTANGTKVALDFTGVRLNLCIQPNGAKYQLLVDDAAVEFDMSSSFNDPQCREMGASLTLSTELLPQASHKAELRILEASTSSEFRLFGGFTTANVDVERGTFGDLEESNVEDLEALWVDKPRRGLNAWDTIQYGALDQGNTMAFNCIYSPDQTASLDFSGATALVLWGNFYADTHSYSVEFDGTIFNGDASTSQWSAGSAPLFMQTGLDTGKNYTITLRNFNDNVANCTGRTDQGLARTCCVGLDRLQLFGSNLRFGDGISRSGTPVAPISTEPLPMQTPVSPNPSASDSSPSNTVIIIAAVLGVVVGIYLFTLVICWRWRRTRRRSPPLDRPLAPFGRQDVEAFDAREDAMQKWIHSLEDDSQDQITAFHASTAVSQGPTRREKVSQWAAKPLAALRRGPTSPSAAPPYQPDPYGAPLQSADLNHILACIAARIDSPRPGSSTEQSLFPPTYRDPDRLVSSS